MISLEAMHHDEEVDADLAVICCSPSGSTILIAFHNLWLTHFISAFDFLNEYWVLVVAVAFLEYYRADLSQWFLQSLSLYLQVRRVEIDHVLVWVAHLSHLCVALFKWLPFYTGEVLVRLTYVLVGIVRKQGKVPGWNHLTEDWLGPLLTCLMLILNLEVLWDKARGSLDDLDNFVL